MLRRNTHHQRPSASSSSSSNVIIYYYWNRPIGAPRGCYRLTVVVAHSLTQAQRRTPNTTAQWSLPRSLPELLADIRQSRQHHPVKELEVALEHSGGCCSGDCGPDQGEQTHFQQRILLPKGDWVRIGRAIRPCARVVWLNGPLAFAKDDDDNETPIRPNRIPILHVLVRHASVQSVRIPHTVSVPVLLRHVPRQIQSLDACVSAAESSSPAAVAATYVSSSSSSSSLAPLWGDQSTGLRRLTLTVVLNHRSQRGSWRLLHDQIFDALQQPTVRLEQINVQFRFTGTLIMDDDESCCEDMDTHKRTKHSNECPATSGHHAQSLILLQNRSSYLQFLGGLNALLRSSNNSNGHRNRRRRRPNRNHHLARAGLVDAVVAVLRDWYQATHHPDLQEQLMD